jgi:hypothetical protein
MDLADIKAIPKQFFMRRNIKNAVSSKGMKSYATAVVSQKSCGRCGKAIRMREGLNALLCTAKLGVVDANFEDMCEDYEERGESAGLLFLGQTG